MKCVYCKQDPCRLTCVMAPKSRMTPRYRIVDGIMIRRSFGHRYTSKIAGKYVIFRAVLRDSGAIRSWESVYSHHSQGARIAGVGTFTLKDCVRLTNDLLVNSFTTPI